MKVFAIGEDFANVVLDYLARQPYREVSVFVEEFKKLMTVEQYQNMIADKNGE